VDIELYSLLALAILLTSVATVLFALFTYVMFRIRETRKLKKAAAHGSAAGPAPAKQPEPAQAPQFFKPYEPSV
jgi:hypothetical protein